MTSGRTPTPRAAMTASINSTGSALYYGGRSPLGTTGDQSYVRYQSIFFINLCILSTTYKI